MPTFGPISAFGTFAKAKQFHFFQAQEPAPELEVLPDDDEEEVLLAKRAKLQLEALERIRTAALQANLPAALSSSMVAISLLKRGRVGRNKKSNSVLRRHMDKVMAQEQQKRRERRDVAEKAKANHALVLAAKAKAAAAKEKKTQQKKELQAQVAALPVTFVPAEVGQAGKAGAAHRAKMLERLMLRSPKLSLADQIAWEDLRQKYADYYPNLQPHGTGVAFIHEVNKVLKSLGKCYKGPTEFDALRLARRPRASFSWKSSRGFNFLM